MLSSSFKAEDFQKEQLLFVLWFPGVCDVTYSWKNRPPHHPTTAAIQRWLVAVPLSTEHRHLRHGSLHLFGHSLAAHNCRRPPIFLHQEKNTTQSAHAPLSLRCHLKILAGEKKAHSNSTARDMPSFLSTPLYGGAVVCDLPEKFADVR